MTSSTSSSSPRPWSETPLLARLAAVVAPLLILALATQVILGVRSEDLSIDAAAIDEALATAQPDVVILGNSIAGSGVDDVLMTQLLQPYGVRRVLSLATDGTHPVHWYLMVRDRIAAAPRKPRLVLIWSNEGALQQVEPEGDVGLAALLSLTDLSDPFLRERVYVGRPTALAWAVATQGRAALRDTLVQRPTYEVAGRLFGDGMSGDAAERGFELVRQATGILLRTPGGLGVTAGVVGPRPPAPPREAQDTALTDSLLPDLLAVLRDNGMRPVVVVAPQKVSLTQGCTRAGMSGMWRLQATLGFDLLDLSCSPVSLSSFLDGAHLYPQGATEASTAAAEVLAYTGLASGGPSWTVTYADTRGVSAESP